MRLPSRIGDEWPCGSSSRHTRFLPGPNSTGTLVAARCRSRWAHGTATSPAAARPRPVRSLPGTPARGPSRKERRKARESGTGKCNSSRTARRDDGRDCGCARAGMGSGTGSVHPADRRSARVQYHQREWPARSAGEETCAPVDRASGPARATARATSMGDGFGMSARGALRASPTVRPARSTITPCWPASVTSASARPDPAGTGAIWGEAAAAGPSPRYGRQRHWRRPGWSPAATGWTPRAVCPPWDTASAAIPDR